MLLVEMLDKVVHILEEMPQYDSFMLDGQTVVLEDYLEVRPEAESRLRKLVEGKRLIIGPWYVLADTFIPSGEALVRNLMFGKRIADRFGARMNCGYLPDVFGYNSQIPQILRGFSIDNAQVYRGVGPEVKSTEFLWKSPDGSTVLATYLPFGYWNFVLGDMENEENYAITIIKMEKLAATKNILLLNGSDHCYPDPHLPEKLDHLRKSMPDAEVIHSNLPSYVRAVRTDIDVAKLIVVEGELRKNRPARITPGVISTRVYLKQMNRRVETLLERYAEPLSVASWLIGGVYDRGLFTVAWKNLLLNHPHDSICGCSVDDVHREMIERFTAAEQIGTGMVSRAIANLSAKIDTLGKQGIPVIVFNTLDKRRSDVVTCDAILKRSGELALIDCNGNQVEAVVLFGSESRAALKRIPGLEHGGASSGGEGLGFAAEAPSQGQKKVILQFIGRDIPSCGWKTYWIVQRGEKRMEHHLRVGDHFIENEFYHVEVLDHGELKIIDKETNAVFKDAHYFLDGSDAGDEYNYSPALFDEIVDSRRFSARWKITSKFPVKVSLRVSYMMLLPIALKSDRKSRSLKLRRYFINSEIMMYEGVRRIDFETEINNCVKDHRLRVAFDTPIKSGFSCAHSPFDCVKRPLFVSEEARILGHPPQLLSGQEVEVATFPQSAFVDVSDGNMGACLINRGLPEYEVLPPDEGGGARILLTLLRGVGWLSRRDLLTRRAGAGPMIETPGAQCLGRHTFSYSLYLHKGYYDTSDAVHVAIAHNAPMIAEQTYIHKGELSNTADIVSIDGDSIVMSSLKLAESRDQAVLRLYNISEREQLATITSSFEIKEACLLDLQENFKGSIEAVDNRIRMVIGKKQIVTLGLTFGRRCNG